MLQGGKCLLLSREKVPPYFQKQYILSSYLHGGTHAEAAKRTLFSLTNETFNAWTTIFSFLLVNLHFLKTRWGTSIGEDYISEGLIAVDLFYVSGIVHAPFSLSCSLWVGLSMESRDFWRQLDVLGIFTASVFRGGALAWFVLSDGAYRLYIIALMADYLFCITSTMILRRIKDIPRQELVWDIAGMCAGYVFPLIIASAVEVQDGVIGHSTFLLLGVVLCLGLSALVCTTNIPEKWRPGAFDIVHSHALMHIFVYLEYYFEYIFLCHHMGTKGILPNN